MAQTKDYDYGTLRLKRDTIEFLKEMKAAFEDSYQHHFTMDEFIKQMAASVEEGDQGVWDIYCIKQAQKDELMAKIADSQRLRELKNK